MDKDQIKQHLFDPQARLFGVLDGASVPDLPTRLYESQLPNYCLMSGDLDPDLAYVAPYLVQLSPDSKFTDSVIDEGFGKHWGVFAHTRRSITDMRTHFRALLTVFNEQGDPMIFRFYDPRVLRRFLPTCNGGELKTLFGNVERFFAEDEARSISSYSLENGELKQTELT